MVKVYKNPTATITLNGEKLKAFLPRLETSQGSLLSPLLFLIVLEVVATANRQGKKGIQMEDEVKFADNMTLCFRHPGEFTHN